MKCSSLLSLVLLFTICHSFFPKAQAVDLQGWQTLTIPEAKCGDGSPYKVWFKPETQSELNAQKSLLIEFMGGGACWSQKTCFGVGQRTFFHSLPAPLPGLATTNKSRLPENFQTAATLYLGYCTGDVHLGQHQANYGFENGFFHHGKKNIELTFKYLFKQGIINPYTFENLLVTGSSAGAFGALIHAQKLERFFPYTENKILIADAPGLHFSDRFWQQFPQEFERDFKSAFTELDLDFDNSSGVIARHLPKICQRFSNWKIGLLQGSKDMVMSSIFGKLSPWEHRRRILADTGMINMAQRTQNCSIWVPDTFLHTFLIAPVDGAKVHGVGPYEFVNQVIKYDHAISLHF